MGAAKDAWNEILEHPIWEFEFYTENTEGYRLLCDKGVLEEIDENNFHITELGIEVRRLSLDERMVQYSPDGESYTRCYGDKSSSVTGHEYPEGKMTQYNSDGEPQSPQRMVRYNFDGEPY